MTIIILKQKQQETLFNIWCDVYVLLNLKHVLIQKKLQIHNRFMFQTLNILDISLCVGPRLSPSSFYIWMDPSGLL